MGCEVFVPSGKYASITWTGRVTRDIAFLYWHGRRPMRRLAMYELEVLECSLMLLFGRVESLDSSLEQRDCGPAIRFVCQKTSPRIILED